MARVRVGDDRAEVVYRLPELVECSILKSGGPRPALFAVVEQLGGEELRDLVGDGVGGVVCGVDVSGGSARPGKNVTESSGREHAADRVGEMWDEWVDARIRVVVLTCEIGSGFEGARSGRGALPARHVDSLEVLRHLGQLHRVEAARVSSRPLPTEIKAGRCRSGPLRNVASRLTRHTSRSHRPLLLSPSTRGSSTVSWRAHRRDTGSARYLSSRRRRRRSRVGRYEQSGVATSVSGASMRRLNTVECGVVTHAHGPFGTPRPGGPRRRMRRVRRTLRRSGCGEWGVESGVWGVRELRSDDEETTQSLGDRCVMRAG